MIAETSYDVRTNEDFLKVWAFKDPAGDGSYLSLAGCAVHMQIRTRPGTDSEPVATVTADIVTNPKNDHPNEAVRVFLLHGTIPAGFYFYDVVLIDAAAIRRTVRAGTFEVNNGVTVVEG